MTQPIHKYPLGSGQTELPAGQILNVGYQCPDIVVWIWEKAGVDAKQTLAWFPTGAEVDPHEWEHIGTIEPSPWVWHVFRKRVG